jgi:hypothetical protein
LGKYTKTADVFFINSREIDGVKEHRCTSCQEWKPETTEYYYLKNKSKPEKGFQSECKECCIKRSQKTASKMSLEKKEQLKLIRKERYENREKEIELERSRIWFENNKDTKKIYMKEYYAKHPEQMRKYSRQHRNHNITPNEWEAVQEYFNYRCAYCGKTLEQQYKDNKQQFHREHVDHEGLNDITNCVCSCTSCNSIKHTKSLEEFFESKRVLEFTKDKYNKTIKWLMEDCFQYIEEKKPKRKYSRKKNVDIEKQDIV